ncbi:MAG: type II toxin-antitoxin system RelE/ParE family toxin [Magnetococcales bacterium]|nr:type II toxin-antitoxin system RelE/ParE family toxin [Magnetococcales bacterium]
MKKIRFSRLAKQDLENIRNFYIKINPEVAVTIKDHLKKSFLLLQNNPNIGHITGDYDVFEWHVPGTKYSIPYMIENQTVIILRVFDERQNRPDSWKI